MASIPEADPGGTASKRPRMDCLIHCSSEDRHTKLVSPKDSDSWKSLLRAAEIRDHAPILEIARDLPDGVVPAVTYHRQCRSIFTMKKALDAIIANKEPKEQSTSERKSTREAPSQSRLYEAKCIFCDKPNKYLRGQKTRELLTQCVELRADEKIRKAAVAKVDNRMLAIVSRELVAAEGHYHRSCYRLYTKDVVAIHTETEYHDDEEEQYEATEKEAYKELFKFIRGELFVNPEVVPMTELTSELVRNMNALGVTEIKPSTKKHIRRKLETEFGESLQILPNDKGKLILYPDCLSMCELAKKYQALQTQMQTMQSATSDDIIYKTALQLRNDIRSESKTQPWPPHTSEEEQANDLIPPSVNQFLYTLLTGSTNCVHPSERVQRLANSFGQDWVYAITCGRIKPLKHVILPFAVKSLTGNVELVRTLNRLGHSVSYSQAEEIDTALCLQKLAVSGGGVAIPGNIHTGIFTTVAWDNIDRLEETVSGEGTSHRVNGIAVQAKLAGPSPARPKPVVEKNKQRSIDVEPLTLPIYNVGQRVGPLPIQTLEVDISSATQRAIEKNLIWVLARISETIAQTTSSWTGFNILTRNDATVVQDSVGYLPTVNAPATQMSTVNEVLNQSLTIMQSLELDNIVCVFDQALYAKAAEVAWKHPDKFKPIILRMGVFHTICAFLATIGKRFQDAGLRDLCVEAGVIADGSITGVMEGRKYNRSVRMHKLLYEAFMRLAWKGFLPWLEAHHEDALVHLADTLAAISQVCENTCQASLQKVMENKSYVLILKHFGVYMDYLRHENGSLSTFWMSYLDMVEILLGLLRASREGDWPLHLAYIRKVIPWCFAYDRQNYARYLPYYYAQMSRLAVDYPNVHAQFVEGGFSVQIGPKNPFGKIPVDQTIEETVNKDTQTPGGTKGFSLKPGAVSKYYLTTEYRSSYLRQLRAMVGHDCSHQVNHPDLQMPRIRKDEANVKAFMELMENSWVNPLSQDRTDLINLSTGVVAPANVASDLLKAQTIGEEAYETFKKDRLENEVPTTKFHDTMKKQKLKTFAHIKKRSSTEQTQGKQVVLKADRNLFGHMLLIAQSRQLQLKDVLAHPLGPLPWTLANSDGTLRKTNKAALARELEKNVSPAEEFPEPSVCIIDGMSIVQKMKGDGKTFSQIADAILSVALHEGVLSNRVDVVFDVYRETSIKNAERCNRGSTTGTQWKNIAPGHNILQWRKFLNNPQNKTSLIKFLVEQWKLPTNRSKLQDKVLYVTCEELCYKLTKEDFEEVDALKTSQEEADTRLFLHATHASENGYRSIVISSEDTDVMILCLGYSMNISCPMYQKCGTANRTRYIDISKLGNSLGDNVCQGLIGLHAFTGCDTVSAFAGRGKLSALKLLKKNEKHQDTFKELGQSWNVSQELSENIEEFVCQLYASSTSTHDVNELRYNLFCAKRGEVESSQLPPCKDCLRVHIARANYQSAIWRRCLENNAEVPDPKEHGWTTDDDGSLTIQWMQGAPAPEAVLQMLSCKCTRICKLPDCTCMANQLKCTDMCKLQTCTNQKTDEDEDDAEVDADDSDSDDDE